MSSLSEEGRPGPMTRASSKRDARKQGSAPYMSRSASKKGNSSTGLTSYMSNTTIDFDGPKKAEEEEMDEDEVGELDMGKRTRTITGKALSLLPGRRKKKAAESSIDEDEEELGRSVSTFGRALSSFRPGKAAQPKEIDIWKPTENEVFGVTFEVPDDPNLKGIVVADIRAGGLAARSKKLKVGDVLHVVNGQPCPTPQQAASLLRDAKGVVQLVVTRAGAAPKRREGEEPEHEIKDKTKSSFLSFKPKEKKKSAEPPPADEANTTVVVSCSALILESKKIVGDAGGIAEQLDELYTQLKAKAIKSQAALQKLNELVGQTTVEQAGLVIANSQQGSLPEGWVEYYDKVNGRPYYYNVHTKTTTWYKPRKDKPPPPPPGGAGSSRRSADKDAEMPDAAQRESSGDMVGVDANSTSQGHAVSEAIAAMQTKKKMVESVQIECKRVQAGGKNGLETVSL